MNDQEANEYFEEFWEQHPYKSIDGNGNKWKYITSGKPNRHAILLIHGGMVDAGMWAYQIQTLRELSFVIAPSFPIVFQSFRELCDMTVKILLKEGIETADIVGLSFGGLVAQYLVYYYPEKINRLVLSNTFKPSLTAARRQKKKRLIKWMPNFLLAGRFKTRFQNIVESEWSAYRRIYFQSIVSKMSKHVIAEFFHNFGKSMEKELPKSELWKGETLILTSEDDEVYKYLEELNEAYPDALVHLFQHGGHHTALLFPKEYTAKIKSFLVYKK